MRFKIIFSKHAENRRLQRGINKETVKSIIKNPSYTRSSFDNRTIAIKRIGNFLGHIIYTSEENSIRVVTGYYE